MGTATFPRRGAGRSRWERLESRTLQTLGSISISDAAVEVGDVGRYLLGFVAKLSAPSDQVVTVDYTTVGNETAVEHPEYGDYEAEAGTITFAPGETERWIQVSAFGATGPRPEKRFGVALANPVNATLGDATGSAIITNDGGGAVSVADAVATHGPGGATALLFPVQLSRAFDVPVVVSYATVANGTAAAGVDFLSTQGTLTFAPGETAKQVVVPVLGGPGHSADRTLTLRLTQAANASIGRSVGVGFVKYDEGRLSIDERVATQGSAGSGRLVFTVRSSAPSREPIVVSYATVANGTAAAGVDFLSTQGTLTFAPGETAKQVVVPVLGTMSFGGDKTFTVVLSGGRLERSSGVGVIQSPPLLPSGGDDTAAIQERLDRGLAVRLGPGTFQISRTLRLTASGQALIGAGPATVLACRGDFTTAVQAAGLNRVEVRDLEVDADRVGRQAVLTTRTMGIALLDCSDSSVVRCTVRGTVGGPVASGSPTLYAGQGIVIVGDRNAVLACRLLDLGVKVPGSEYLISDGVYAAGQSNIIKGCLADGVTDTAFVLEDSDFSGVMDCTTVRTSAGLGISNGSDTPGTGNYGHNLVIDDWDAGVTGGISISTPRPGGSGDLRDTTLSFIHLGRRGGRGPAINVRRTGVAKVDGLSVSDVTIEGSGTQGIVIDGFNVEVSDCTIRNTSWTGVQIQAGSRAIVVRDCTIDNPTMFGITVLAPTEQVALAGNAIVGRGRMDWGIYRFGASPTLILSRNTITGYAAGSVGTA